MVYKVKSFSADKESMLEKDINAWLARLPPSVVVDRSETTVTTIPVSLGSVQPFFLAMVWYRE